MIVFSRSSNCPRYLVPATISERSSANTRLSARKLGTSPSAMRCASPSTIAVLPTPGSPISTGLFFVRRQRIWITRSNSPSRPTSGSRCASIADCVRSRLNSASRLLSRCRACCGAFSCVTRANSSRIAASFSPRSCSISAAKHFSSRNSPSSKCSVPICLCPSRLFRSIGQHPLALVRERQIDRSRNLLSNRGVCLNLLSYRLHRCMRAQKPVGQCFVFAQQAEQQVLGFNIGRTKLAGLIPREEDYASRLLRVAFEHGVPFLSVLSAAVAVPLNLVQLRATGIVATANDVE